MIGTTLSHWGKALSPPWEGQEEERKEAEAGMGGWGLPGVVRDLVHSASIAWHLQGTDWGKSGGSVLKSQRSPVTGLERKGNLESSLKEELC